MDTIESLPNALEEFILSSSNLLGEITSIYEGEYLRHVSVKRYLVKPGQRLY